MKRETTWRHAKHLACSEVAHYYARRNGFRLEIAVKNRNYGNCIIASIDEREPGTGAVTTVLERRWPPKAENGGRARRWCERRSDDLARAAKALR